VRIEEKSGCVVCIKCNSPILCFFLFPNGFHQFGEDWILVLKVGNDYPVSL